MSLLLEALKKAELTKQAAKERLAEDDRAPFTRDRLPDISQAIEIHSEDLSLVPEPEPEPEPVLESAPVEAISMPAEERVEPMPEPEPAAEARPEPVRRAAPPARTPAQAETVERKQAQQLFEAKELDINPRKPFYITLGVLGVFALCTVGYFWYQLQPRNNFRTPPPVAQSGSPPPAPAAAPAAAAEAPAPAPAPVAAAPADPGARTVSPPSGSQPAAAAAAKASAPATADTQSKAGATASAAIGDLVKKGSNLLAQTVASFAPPTGRGEAAQRGAASTRAPAAARPADPAGETSAASAPSDAPRRNADITINPASSQVDPVLEAAFDAFNAGDLNGARGGYQQVLRSSPASRDALLGLAAVETRANRPDAAEAYYLRLLEMDPRDLHAQAGLIGLRGQSDPVASESRLKNLISSQPDAVFLHFALGNQLAAQSRWPEAQQAYFRAYTGEPGNADFAFNLAVSLDQIRQPKVALDYYRRALSLAGNRQVSFDKAQVAKRISQLER